MALKRSKIFYYSLADLPVSMALFPVFVFLPKYYTSDLGVPLALVGTLIFIVRLSDVLTDPVCGFITDRVNTRWGRRKPWIAVSVPLLMVSVYNLFLPPDGAGAWHLFGWMLLLSIATTLLLIPYYAWGADLSSDYDERSRITGWRSAVGVVGNLFAQLAPAGALFFFGIGGTESVLMIVGTTMLVLMPVCVLPTLLLVADTRPAVERNRISVIAGIKLMASNRPFLRLIAAFLSASIGASLVTPLYLFFITFVLKQEAEAIYLLTVFYLASLISIPFWVRLSARINKHRAYMLAFTSLALVHPAYLLLGPGDLLNMMPLSFLSGFFLGCSNPLTNSMKADVIDIDELESGENRAGLFFSTYSLAAKASGSLGVPLAMFGLALVGFDPTAGDANTEAQLLGLSVMIGVVPSFFYLTAVAIIWKYPITRDSHAAIRAQLDARLMQEQRGAS